ncbi:hypothetical protein [Phocaeicola massiliensis]|jgi:hypothetical protein|uniref:hypothetical protein n=1 Tax=Phocaeicola massiliensis TaxID=204516 RepID=UPI00202EAB62|nr:hypothetical protein [Phocaeicola massiliensis]MCM1616509.1 hypothetical protein [Phocaeicola massiliensis]MCM1708156.1 hypothetical protein [Phocaeicola massiliensis]
MIYKVKLFILILLTSLLYISCNSKKSDISEQIKSLRNETINLDGSVIDTLQTSKILILVPDTGDCTPCTMQVYDWYIYKLDLKRHNINCDIIYILNDSIKLNPNVNSIMHRYSLHQTKNLSLFYSKNKKLKNIPFTTFLIDKDNKIKLIGSPIDNERLWALYKQLLTE